MVHQPQEALQPIVGHELPDLRRYEALFHHLQWVRNGQRGSFCPHYSNLLRRKYAAHVKRRKPPVVES